MTTFGTAGRSDVRDTDLGEAELHARLVRTWRTGSSLMAKLSPWTTRSSDAAISSPHSYFSPRRP